MTLADAELSEALGPVVRGTPTPILTAGQYAWCDRLLSALADPADLMEAFQLLTSQENQDKLGYKIVRFKNKFHPSSTDTFKNIMVNALVRGGAQQVFCLRTR